MRMRGIVDTRRMVGMGVGIQTIVVEIIEGSRREWLWGGEWVMGY